MKTVIFALIQVVVIVSGILAAGLVYKLTQSEAHGIGFLIHYGYLIFAIPLLWTTAFSLMRFRRGLVYEIDPLEFVSGFYLTIILGITLAIIPIRAFAAAVVIVADGAAN